MYTVSLAIVSKQLLVIAELPRIRYRSPSPNGLSIDESGNFNRRRAIESQQTVVTFSMGEKECDVVVVGLGAMGSAVIDHLAMKGFNVIGLDRYDPPHDQGSSHGDTRITRQAVGEGDVYVPFVLRSQDRWKELEQEMGVSLFEQCGTVIIGDPKEAGSHHGKDDFLLYTSDIAKQFGTEHFILDQRSLLSKFPQFKGMRPNEIAYYEQEVAMFVRKNALVLRLDMQSCMGLIFFPTRL